jgi:hypothetical protein
MNKIGAVSNMVYVSKHSRMAATCVKCIDSRLPMLWHLLCCRASQSS